MERTESGGYLIPREELETYRQAAAFLREHAEIPIDLAGPIPLEQAMYLKFCQVGLQGDIDTLQRALAEFDKLIELAGSAQ